MSVCGGGGGRGIQYFVIYCLFVFSLGFNVYIFVDLVKRVALTTLGEIRHNRNERYDPYLLIVCR